MVIILQCAHSSVFKIGNNAGKLISSISLSYSYKEGILHMFYVHLCFCATPSQQVHCAGKISSRMCYQFKSLHLGTVVSGFILHQTESILNQIPGYGIPCPPKINMSFPLGCCTLQPSNTNCVCFLPHFYVFLFNLANNDIM